MANDGFNPKSGHDIITSGNANLVSFASLALNNPDLPKRVKNNWPLN